MENQYSEGAVQELLDIEREKLKELHRLSNIFFTDVMPQIGGLCLQDYASMNDLGILLDKISREIE